MIPKLRPMPRAFVQRATDLKPAPRQGPRQAAQQARGLIAKHIQFAGPAANHHRRQGQVLGSTRRLRQDQTTWHSASDGWIAQLAWATRHSTQRQGLHGDLRRPILHRLQDVPPTKRRSLGPPSSQHPIYGPSAPALRLPARPSQLAPDRAEWLLSLIHI